MIFELFLISTDRPRDTLSCQTSMSKGKSDYSIYLGAMDTLVWLEWQFVLDMSWKGRWGSDWKVHSVKVNGVLLEQGRHPKFRNGVVRGKKSNVFKSIMEWECTSFVVEGWGLKAGRHIWRCWINSTTLWPYKGCLEKWDTTPKSRTSVYTCMTDSFQALFPQLSNDNNQSPLL